QPYTCILAFSVNDILEPMLLLLSLAPLLFLLLGKYERDQIHIIGGEANPDLHEPEQGKAHGSVQATPDRRTQPLNAGYTHLEVGTGARYQKRSPDPDSLPLLYYKTFLTKQDSSQ
ncbi:Hypothetical predicted protein, partial [Pelobates cultripes]